MSKKWTIVVFLNGNWIFDCCKQSLKRILNPFTHAFIHSSTHPSRKVILFLKICVFNIVNSCNNFNNFHNFNNFNNFNGFNNLNGFNNFNVFNNYNAFNNFNSIKISLEGNTNKNTCNNPNDQPSCKTSPYSNLKTGLNQSCV